MTAILLKINLNRLISREARSELGLRQVLGLRVGKKYLKIGYSVILKAINLYKTLLCVY